MVPGLLVAVLVTGIVVLLYSMTIQVMQRQLQMYLTATASLAAERISWQDADAVFKKTSKAKEAFTRMSTQLYQVRRNVPAVRFAYALAPTANPWKMHFVADADAVATSAELDVNDDGVVAEDEVAAGMNEEYDVSENDPLYGPAYTGAVSDLNGYTDQWGTFVSGYAPVRRADGTVAAIVGVDMEARMFYSLSRGAFSPAMVGGVIFAVLAMLLALSLWFMDREYFYANEVERERQGVLQVALHRFGTPLTLFKWTAEMLLDLAPKNSGDPFKEEVHEAAEHLTAGIRDMQDVYESVIAADTASGKASVKGDSSLKAAYEAASADLQQHFGDKQQTLDTNDFADARVAVPMADMKTLFLEILENARIYSPAKSTIVIRSNVKHGQATVTVSDAGEGISKADLARLFQKFARGTNAPKFDPNGNGLGLYICQQLVKRVKGSVTVESAEGKGTTVTLQLPLA